MHSAICHGWLEHARLRPRPHAFRYRLFMLWLDLAELDQVFRGRWLWSTKRAALARFERRDHLGDPAVPLDEAVRRLVAARTGARPSGPIRLLTHLRYFGYVFNPVSFYFCFDAADQVLESVVAEVNNTPWGERHCYVLGRSGERAMDWSARSSKALHVSPFMPMELEYLWRFGLERDRLSIEMALRPPPDGADASPARTASSVAAPGPLFHARLALRRQPIGAAALAGALLRFPLMTLRVVGAIHWQALRLWLKRVPVHTHPARTGVATVSAPPT